MVSVLLEFGGDAIFDRTLNLIDVFAGGEAAAVAQPEDMRIHRLRRDAPPHVQDDIGRLAPDAGQRDQRLTRRWDHAAVFINDLLAQLDDVLGLVAVKADGLDVLDQAVLTQRQHLFRRVRDLEQLFRRPVDALVGRLSG